MAQTVTNTSASPFAYAVTVGTAVQAGVPPNPGRNALWLWNNSASGTITLCPAQFATIAQGATPYAALANTNPIGVVGPLQQGIPTINGPGSITLSAGQSVLLDTVNVGGAWNAIGSANGLSLTVLEGT